MHNTDPCFLNVLLDTSLHCEATDMGTVHCVVCSLLITWSCHVLTHSTFSYTHCA